MSATVHGKPDTDDGMPANAAGGLGFFAGIVFSIVLSLCFEDAAEVRREAVRTGHAEWRADKDGKPEFRWKGPAK